jgi:hypothetical protein
LEVDLVLVQRHAVRVVVKPTAYLSRVVRCDGAIGVTFPLGDRHHGVVGYVAAETLVAGHHVSIPH